VVGSAIGEVSGGDVAFEINHPGGYCWGAGTGLNVTPDIQAGDVVSLSFNGVRDAATTTLDIFASDDVIARNRVTSQRMAALAAPFAAHPHVAEVRQAGMIVAFELTRDGNKATAFDSTARIGLRAYRAALDRGVLLRPLGDVLYWMPPYCIDEEALQLLATTTRAAIDHAIEEAGACA